MTKIPGQDHKQVDAAAAPGLWEVAIQYDGRAHRNRYFIPAGTSAEASLAIATRAGNVVLATAQNMWKHSVGGRAVTPT
jgi:hypothetical protein